jgi:iron complex outermembrane receptor protein
MYAENQHYFLPSFSLLTGVQGVYVGRVYKDRYPSPVNGNQSTNQDYFAINPKVGVLYDINDKSQAYVNVSRSFQPPSFDQFLTLADDGNRIFNHLKAQNAVTVEVGTRGKAGAAEWDVAFYNSWIRDELLDLTNGNGEPLGTVNANKTTHQGIEAQLEVELYQGAIARGIEKDRFVLEQTYNWSNFRFSDDPVYGNNQIAGAPVQYYKAELRYEHPCGFYCGPNLEWNIVKYAVDEANTLYADPYALLGFRAGYKSRKGWEVFFEGKNLTNKIYAATVEPVGNAQVEGGDSFNPGVGRAFYGGFSYSW